MRLAGAWLLEMGELEHLKLAGGGVDKVIFILLLILLKGMGLWKLMFFTQILTRPCLERTVRCLFKNQNIKVVYTFEGQSRPLIC